MRFYASPHLDWFLLLLLCSACAAQQAASVDSPAFKDLARAHAKVSAIESAHPGNSIELAEALHELAGLVSIGEFPNAEALPLANREVAVAMAVAGAQSTAYANGLSDTAEVYEDQNQLAEARPFAEQAYEIAHKLKDEETELHVSQVLADICNALGDFACSLRVDEAAIAIERKPGPDHDWNLAATLSNLGDVKERMGDTAGAGAAIVESLAAALRSHPNDPLVAIIESNVGTYYLRQQKFSEAISHLNRAIEISTQTYGPNNADVLRIISNLADIYSRSGQFPLAWKTYEQTIGNRSQTLDTVARLRVNYARSLASGGSLQAAIDEGLLAARMGRESFVLQARTLPERQALAYSEHRPKGLDAALSVLARHPEIPSANVYQEVVRSRALVADEMARREKNLNATNDPEIARRLKEMGEARVELLGLEAIAPGEQAKSRNLAEATERMEKIERALAERSADLRNDERISAVRLEDLRHNLPAHAVLISYVTYQRGVVEKIDPAQALAPAYMAFVLRHPSDQIQVFDLGDAAAINALVRKARASADAEAHGGGMGSTRNERDYREAALQLRQKIWDPLTKEIGDATLALVVADGNLNLIPFAGLPQGNGYLVDHGPVIHMLSSERDLVPALQEQKKVGLLAIGNPTFQLAENKLPLARLRGASPNCDEFGKMEFEPLPATATEIADVRNAWTKWNATEPAQTILGDSATLSQFIERAPHSRVLHIATHAFLLNKGCGNGNPLLHSGLVFAGGSKGAAQSILTAQQVASLDLDGVDWAVLSACNTGNGELQDGEGVLGLQRAFRMAGAHSVIMTLWPVDDDGTRQFMHELYSQRLGRHSSTAVALWNSSRNLLLERRAAHKSTHPWYWAGFVASGGWD